MCEKGPKLSVSSTICFGVSFGKEATEKSKNLIFSSEKNNLSMQ